MRLLRVLRAISIVLRALVLHARFFVVAVGTGSAVAVGVTANPAAAHTHPTPVELDSPAVVRVETYAQVSISLIEHNRAGVHIGLLQRMYTPLLAAGSGFAVDPSGGIVTAQKVIDVDLRRAEIYAVNKIFNEKYGNAAPLPQDPFTTHSIADLSPTNPTAGRLQRCYQPNTTDDTGGCVVFSTRVVKVLPFVTSQKQYGDLPATVLFPSATGQSGNVAVLKVGASSMPTVNLATQTQGVTAFSILGFSGVPSAGSSIRQIDGHFEPGTTRLKRDDELRDQITTSVSADLLGGPAVGEAGQVVGFLQASSASTAGSSPDVNLVGPDEIRAALKAASIDPHQGPTDSAYEAAMHNYKNKLYAAAIPSLTQTLKLYPGHAPATQALDDANQKKGTAEDLTGRATAQPGGPSQTRGNDRGVVMWVGVALVALVIVAALVAAFVLRRRRRRMRPAPATAGPPAPASAGPPAPASAGPPAPADALLPTADQGLPDPVREAKTVVIPAGPAAPVGGGLSAGGIGMQPPPDSDATRQFVFEGAQPEPPAAPRFCTSCGEQVLPSQMYCGRCGHRQRKGVG